jgi:hypothetical protein
MGIAIHIRRVHLSAQGKRHTERSGHGWLPDFLQNGINQNISDAPEPDALRIFVSLYTGSAVSPEEKISQVYGGYISGMGNNSNIQIRGVYLYL